VEERVFRGTARGFEDPRQTSTGLYRNLDPATQYVGDARCGECHPDKTVSFRQHPMGHTLAPIDQFAARQVYDQKHHNPFEGLGNLFRVERQGDRVWHRQTRLDKAGQPIFQHDLEVHYVIGSGTRGYSYLTNLDGYLFQTPISWFSQKQMWDISPGFALPEGGTTRLAGRPVSGDCLFCHANRAHSLESYQNRYADPIFSGYTIGCERCHGPGERHAQSRDRLDIVNPVNLSWGLREAVCEQCHLEGVARVLRRGRELYDFRPGLPLEPFWTVFVLPDTGGADEQAVNHVEQMHRSRCFQGSSEAKKLGCVSCHNPHDYVGPERRVAYYRDRCLSCHTLQSCALPLPARLRENKDDSCIACHMPHYEAEDVAHTAETDHRIVRRPRQPAGPSVPAVTAGPLLVPFHGNRLAPEEDRELARDRGLALILAVNKGQIPRSRGSNQALALLGPALEEHSEDVPAWEAKGWGEVLRNNPQAALTAFQEALQRDPNRERSLLGAAAVAQQLRQTTNALPYWRRAVVTNPWMPIYRKQLALLLMEQGSWEEVRTECQAWLRLEPGSIEARRMWVAFLLQKGDQEEARKEFTHIEAFQPPDLEALREWFKRQSSRN
jgi:tetratricopeptide (TPR) repeat protein